MCALQSFRDQPFRAATLPPPRGPRLEFAARSEFGARRVSLALVERLHFAVGLSPAVWCSRDGHHRVVFKASRSFLSSSSAFLPSVLRPILSRLRARQALPRSSLELSSPSARANREGPPVHGLCLPAAFRLQGLGTLLTVCSLRSLFGFVSSRQRSWGLSRPSECSPSARSRRPFGQRRTHAPFLASLLPRTNPQAGPTRRGLWALTLAEALCRRTHR